MGLRDVEADVTGGGVLMTEGPGWITWGLGERNKFSVSNQNTRFIPAMFYLGILEEALSFTLNIKDGLLFLWGYGETFLGHFGQEHPIVKFGRSTFSSEVIGWVAS